MSRNIARRNKGNLQIVASALRPHPQEPFYVLCRGLGYIDPGVEVLGPIHRCLRDPVAPLLDQEQ